MRLTFVAALAALVALAPVSLAQEHAHGEGPRVLLLTDAPEGGRALVGGFTHFGFALVGPDGAPIPHTDHRVTLEQNGRLLFETEDAHEYDGLFSLDWTFTEPGPYEVRAQATDGDTVLAEDSFAGVAVPVNGTTSARVNVTAPSTFSTSTASLFSVVVEDVASGAMIQHSDALVEVRRLFDHALVLRAHLHAHLDPMSFAYHFQTPGEYEMRVVGYNAYPDEEVPDFAAVTTTLLFDVAPGLPAPPGGRAAVAPPPLPAPGDALERATAAPRAAAPASSHEANASAPALFVTRDPTPLGGQDVVGPFTQVRLSGLAYDGATGDYLPHVNFAATVRGSDGILFASDTLHEYDGHYEVLVSGLSPGEYDFALTATKDAWTGEGASSFRVVPPIVPLSAGPYFLELESVGAPRAGEPVELTFLAKGPTGMPLDHVEVDATVLAAWDAVPLTNFKVHTHDAGDMSARVTFPREGEWLVVADPTTLEPRASYTTTHAGPREPIVFVVNVLPAEMGDALAALADSEKAPAVRIPAPGLVAVALAGACVALAVRRPPPGA